MHCGFSRIGWLVGAAVLVHAGAGGVDAWQVGVPIVTYWAGPPLTDRVADQMAKGEWNVVWCSESELDVAARHGLRAQLQDGLLSPATLEEEERRAKLDALIGRVRNHPALYSYFITDEPNATNFAGLGRLVAYLREKDSAHLAYINLFPTYASNEQLGNSGDKVAAYQAHLRQYLRTVRPALISYDHYQFTTKGDSPDYFLNLALIRQAALENELPFLNIVQAATWTPSMRVPSPEEMRFLVYTTLAYGAQGISYYVYCCSGHTGGIANPDGTPTVLYPALQRLNHEFVGIARVLQPLKSTGVYHVGMIPPGGEALPRNSAFRIDPAVKPADFRLPEPVKGVLLGFFGKPETRPKPTYALVVNLDYSRAQEVGVRGPGRLECLDPVTLEWTIGPQKRVNLALPPGGGRLVRVTR